jgi:LmbE family N-acetylglucosaminyl deacetylase
MISIAKKPKHRVKILSMTKGEYGTYIDELKGENLGRIREKELKAAAIIEGISDIEFIGYIDAHVEINHEVIQKVGSYIDAFKPDVIFAPECLYYYYPHDDHIRTGLSVYYNIKKMKKSDRPALFMFHSYVNTHYFPMLYWRTQSRALLAHKSQYWLLLPMYPLRFILGFYFWFRLSRRLRRYVLAEAYRKVNFEADRQKKLGMRQRIFGRIVKKLKILFKPMA